MKRRYAACAAAAMLSAAVGAAAQATGVGPVPVRLQGTWSIPWQGGTEFVRLEGHSFTFYFNMFIPPAAHGQVTSVHNTITFGRSNVCAGTEATGTYRWVVRKAGAEATFTQVKGSTDPCQREPILTKGVWTRVSK